MEQTELNTNDHQRVTSDEARVTNMTGTKEWAKVNVNIQRGCEHGCRYCYARYNACVRYKYCRLEDWDTPVINRKKVDAKYGKYEGRVMFPSTHDITPRNIGECLIVLNKLLIAGNRVLIVSKPHFPCIKVICDTFGRPKYREFKENILFRFTIGSYSDDTLEFWEPNAPKFADRLSCLQYAFNSGYGTSVSCEPYLDGYIDQLYCTCFDWVTDSFWIGKMRDFSRRVDRNVISSEQWKRFVEPLKLAMSNKFVWSIYELMKDKPLIKWKDSIRKVVKESE